MTPIDEILDNFSLLDDWDDRYRYIIELGRGLPPLPEADVQRIVDIYRRRWLIEELWSDQAVGIVGGEPKCCKSFLALDMAVAIASYIAGSSMRALSLPPAPPLSGKSPSPHRRRPAARPPPSVRSRRRSYRRR